MKKNNKTKTLPNSLYHYTSFEVLTHILDLKNECLKERQMMKFHFGNSLQTNDKKEVQFFKDYVYKNKGGEKLYKQVENIRNKIGEPFILSLIHHVNTKSSYPSCEIPMWKMYGNNFAGVRLRFDFKKMQEYYKDKDNIDFAKCQYNTISEMEEKGRNIRNSFDRDAQNSDLENLYKQAILYKTYDWEYENEWRLVAWCNNTNMIDFISTSGRLFIEQEVPLNLLEAVEIGPKADQIAIEGSLNLIKNKLGNIPENHFKIEKSKLQIGYV